MIAVAERAAAEIPAAPASAAERFGGPVLVAAATFAGLVPAADRLLGDPDTLWHAAVGRTILKDRALPWHDTLSHTFAGAPWIAKEWLAQVAFAAAQDLAGWPGTVWLATAAIAITSGLLYGVLAARLRWSVALAATLTALVLLAPHLLARPHVLALVPLLGWAAALIGAAEAGRVPRPATLLILAIWANLHGSFTFAYPLAALIGADAILNVPAERRLRAIRGWALFGVGALVAGVATPYGVAAMGVTFQIFGSGESLPFITEWQPLALDPLGLAALGSAAFVAVILALDPRRNLARLLLLAVLVAMMVRHTRFLDVYGLVAPLLVAGPLAARWPSLARDPAAGTAGRTNIRLAIAGILVIVGSVALVYEQPRPPSRIMPEAALRAAEAAGLTQRPVYNAYDFGGFLIAHGIPTFIDGRTDQLFLGGFISGLYAAVAAEDDSFRRFVERHGAAWALVVPGTDEARQFDRMPGWRRIFGDADAAVYRRD